MSGYQNTFGKPKDNKMLGYLMDRIQLLDPKDVRPAHKYLNDLIDVCVRLRSMNDQRLLKFTLPILRKHFEQRVEALSFDEGILSRLRGITTREFREVQRILDEMPQGEKKRWQWLNGVRVPAALKAECVRAEAESPQGGSATEDLQPQTGPDEGGETPPPSRKED